MMGDLLVGAVAKGKLGKKEQVMFKETYDQYGIVERSRMKHTTRTT